MPVRPVDPFADDFAYQQVADDLVRRIKAGEFELGGRLPAERELAAEYQVGYVTARSAVQVLRERGIAKTAKTRGTFVVKKPLTRVVILQARLKVTQFENTTDSRRTNPQARRLRDLRG